MPSTELSLLHSTFWPYAERFFRLANAELHLGGNVNIRPVETLRSFDRQLSLEAAGASKNPVGKHNFGHAFDFGVFIDGAYQPDDTSGLYLRCGFLGMALGMRWGGNWDRDKNIAEAGENDLGHLENASVTVQQLIEQAGLQT